MNEYALSIIGIAISIGLFLLGYRQTIGAKKERIRTANAEIEKVLVRLIVLEEYTPSPEEITRLIDGKARDLRVQPTEILSESQVLNTVFTRLLESELISRDQREKVITRLIKLIGDAEAQPVVSENQEELRGLQPSRNLATIAMGIMGALASLAGGFLVALPEARHVDVRFSEIVPLVVGTITASVTIIAFIIVIYKIRERQQEEPGQPLGQSEYLRFEREVQGILAKAGISYRLTRAVDRGYDLILERPGQKILVEVKAWRTPKIRPLIRMAANHLREAMDREGATEAILVTPIRLPVPASLERDERIKFLTLSELRDHLAHIAG